LRESIRHPLHGEEAIRPAEKALMKTPKLSFTFEMFEKTGKAVLSVAATTFILFLIGRDVLGEAVIALLLLVPVGWSASQWGQGPGMCAAVTAALAFDFFFIPPFFTFTVGSLEGWLVLIIFSVVAIVVVGRIQSGLTRAQASERDAIFMYELMAALAGIRTQSAVAHTLARQLQQRYLDSRVKVLIQATDQSPGVTVTEPHDGEASVPTTRPDRILPIWNAWGLVGEIQVWRGYADIPSVQSRLLQSFAYQAAQALERTRLAEIENAKKA
jgi:two-component system sensor histidine kinase KdpD